MIEVVIYRKGWEEKYTVVESLEDAFIAKDSYEKTYGKKLKLIGVMFEEVDEND